MTHYIISSQREGRWYVKQISVSKPDRKNYYGGYGNADYILAREEYENHYDSQPEYPVEGPVTGKIGDEVEGYLEYYVDVMGRWMLVDSKEQSDEYLGAKRIVFVPRSASTVEPDEFINKHVKMIKEKIATKKHDFVVDKIKHLQHEPFRASIQYFLDTGSVNGSFYEALQKIMDFYKPTEEEAVKNLLEVQPEKERFKMPTDQQLVNTAILFNDGRIDKQKLADMVAMCEFVVNRLYENGDIAIPSSSEKE